MATESTLEIQKTIEIQSKCTKIVTICTDATSNKYLQRRQPLPTVRTLQPILHPPFQAGRVENVPARRDHVQPPGQHETARDIAGALARFHDRDFQVLHTNRTVESPLAFALCIFVLG
jgi:hypothetical protein